ncbi:DUF2344 domain-containing protein [bacterium]|nr:DUF2344 domain-containing protein [bacterium]
MTTAPTEEFSFRAIYSRTGAGIYFSHLDTMKALIRAIRRSGLPYKLTHGFHVRPKVCLGPPLPLGHASQYEIIDFFLDKKIPISEIRESLSPQMPQGLKILEITEISSESKMNWNNSRVRYRFVFHDSDKKISLLIKEFFSNSHRLIDSKKASGAKQYPLGNFFQIIGTQEADHETSSIIIDFQQGQPNSPSASKIINALLNFLGEAGYNIDLIERIAIFP